MWLSPIRMRTVNAVFTRHISKYFEKWDSKSESDGL
jgi:hypothetical protein